MAIEMRVAPGLRSDRWLMLIVLTVTCFGLVMIYAASDAFAYTSPAIRSTSYFVVRQAIWVALGLAGMLIASRIDHRHYRRLAGAGALVAVVLMALVFIRPFGADAVGGAHRWLRLPSPLGAFQPSEAGKLLFAIYAANWLERRRDRLHDFRKGILPFLLLAAVPALLLVFQRDLGTLMVTMLILLSALFTAGVPIRWMLLVVAVGVTMVAFLALRESYRADRIANFLHPFDDPQHNGYQSTQALYALGGGGLWGRGLGHSLQKYLWLPEAHTDFIYAIVGEETGLIGCGLLVAGFLLIAWRGYRAAMRAETTFGHILASSITTWIVAQALLNIGAVSNTIPITGVPLPFVSYGGTAVAVALVAVGVVLNISKQAGGPARREEEVDEAADLGRRDRWTPVAGAGGGARLSNRASGR